MANVVLVTGVSRYLGGAYARALSSDTSVTRIIGIDVIPPPHGIGRAEFVRADIRNPMIGKIINQSSVDTVIHMNVIATPTNAGGRVTQKEINVIGTMQLLAGCQKAESVKRLIVKSSSAVYGSSPKDPAMYTEDMSPKSLPRGGFGKDSVEVEGYVRGFTRRRPDIETTLLRFANIVGPGIRTPITDYFSLPVIPIPLGYDARMQVCHERDAVDALLLATTGTFAGICNVAGDGFITITQAAAIVGRPVVPVPLEAGGMVGNLVKRTGLADFSADQMNFLAYGRGIDTTRMRRDFQFEPTFTTRGAFEDYARYVGPPVPGMGLVADAAAGLAGQAIALARHALGAVGSTTSTRATP